MIMMLLTTTTKTLMMTMMTTMMMATMVWKCGHALFANLFGGDNEGAAGLGLILGRPATHAGCHGSRCPTVGLNMIPACCCVARVHVCEREEEKKAGGGGADRGSRGGEAPTAGTHIICSFRLNALSHVGTRHLKGRSPV